VQPPRSLLELPDETTEVVQGLGRFIETRVRPVEDELAHLLADPRALYDESGRYVPEILEARRAIRGESSHAGYYQMFVPESLGGGGMGAVTLYAVWESLYRRFGMQHWLAFDTVAHWATGPSELFVHAGPQLTATVFPELMSGDKTMCFAMSEPNAGSDVWMMRTTAERQGDDWVINGTKQWMTNGPYADFALVFAVTDAAMVAGRKGGLSAFLVPTDAPGYRVDSLIKLYGHVGSNEAIISCTDVKVPGWSLMGELHDGLALGLSGTTLGRLYNAARSVGTSRWALEVALDYCAERQAFGRPVLDNQGVAFPLVDRATEVLGAHLMGLHAATVVDGGGRGIREAAMAKMYSTEVADRTIDQAIQALGGMGLTNETHLTTAWQELRAVRIADGSAEILRRLIAHRLRQGDREL
jgi:acyl-CoA dehydrogenase